MTEAIAEVGADELRAAAQVLMAVAGDSSDMGDCLTALRTIRAALPETRLTLLARPDAATGLAWAEIADEFIPDPLGSGAETDRRLIEELRARKYGAAIIFTPPRRSPYRLAYLAYLAGIPVRAGQSLEWAGSILTHWVRPGPGTLDGERAAWHLRFLAQAFPEIAVFVHVPPSVGHEATNK